MNCLLLEPDEVSYNGQFKIVGTRAQDLIKVHQLRPGISIRAGVIGGLLGRANIISTASHVLELNLVLDEDPPPKLAIDLIVALPRPQTVKKLISLVSSTGIKRLFFIRSEGVDKSYFKSSTLNSECIMREIRLGLAQCCDTVEPIVEIHDRFRPFVEDYLPKVLSPNSLNLIGDTDRKDELQNYSNSGILISGILESDQYCVAIGPERGWSRFEVDCFSQLRFQRTLIGQRILRVDIATALFVGAIIAKKSNNLTSSPPRQD